MLNCWASVFSPVEESRARLGNKFGMNMSRSSLVLWADRRFAPPADRSHHLGPTGGLRTAVTTLGRVEVCTPGGPQSPPYMPNLASQTRRQ